MTEKEEGYSDRRCSLSDCDVRITNITCDSSEFPGSGLTTFPNNFNEQEMEDVQLNVSRTNSVTPEAELNLKVTLEPIQNGNSKTEELEIKTLDPITITITKPFDKVVFFILCKI